MQINKKPEILAPAGSMDALVAAIRCGADAIYLGGKSFSARQNADNFDYNDLKIACELAHKSGAKIHQTINTVVFDDQFDKLEEFVRESVSLGVDAFIVQDLGVINIIKNICPDMPIHASTQMTIHTKQGAFLAKESGFSRIVVAREMSKEQLEDIITDGIEVECFVHGALCMSVSGQCYMSAMIGGRSANRGLCAQACRLPFSAIAGEKRCDLSLKDLSLIQYIKEMADMGIDSLKIEGRMKRPEYVAAAVTACRAVVDGKEPDMDTLRAVFSRSGFTQGYYTNKLGTEMFGTRQKEDVVSADDVFPQLQALYRKEQKITDINFDITIKDGEPTVLKATDGDGNSVTAYGDIPQKAINRPSDLEQAEKQLSKLGDTIYNLRNVTGEIQDGLMLPASAFNNLRRQACDLLDLKRTEKNTTTKSINEVPLSFPKTMNIKPKEMRIDVHTAEQLRLVDMTEIEYAIVPLCETQNLEGYVFTDKIIISLPRYTKNENAVIAQLKKAKEKGFTKIECSNYAHIRIGKILGFEMFGGFGLNATNSYALKSLAEYGLKDTTVSFEMKLSQIERLADYLPYGIIAYGKLPLMLTVNCPIKQAVGCGKCEKKLTDRTNREFDVICGGDAVEILNSDTLYMADRLHEINGVTFITLKFYNETPEQVSQVIEAYKNQKKAPENKFTRGLYYRGIM